MAKLWVALTIAMLTFGVRADGGKAEEEHEEDETSGDEKLPLYVECCMADLVLPIVFKTGEEKCKQFLDHNGGTVGGAEGEKGGAKKHECLVECMLEANGFLDESNTIKEKELGEILLRGVDNEATTTLGAALDKCFTLNKDQEGEKKTICHKAQAVFGCITTEVLENCPDNFWRTDSAECRDGRANKGKVARGAKDDGL